MNAIRSTPENLEGAIAGENREYESMYPELIETAKAEKIKDAEMSFYLANEVEKIHS
jgi:rubrerythrin